MSYIKEQLEQFELSKVGGSMFEMPERNAVDSCIDSLYISNLDDTTVGELIAQLQEISKDYIINAHGEKNYSDYETGVVLSFIERTQDDDESYLNDCFEILSKEFNYSETWISKVSSDVTRNHVDADRFSNLCLDLTNMKFYIFASKRRQAIIPSETIIEYNQLRFLCNKWYSHMYVHKTKPYAGETYGY